MENDFYVYCLFRPWNLEPCYIGKGRGRRSERHRGMGERHSNTHLAAIFKKANSTEVPCVILHDGLDEETAFAYERTFIAAIGRADLGFGPLCNFTDGGEGISGFKHTHQVCIKMADSRRGKPRTEETKERLRLAFTGRKISAETRSKISASLKGRGPSADHMAMLARLNAGNTYNLGRVQSKDWIEKVASANRGKKRSSEFRKKISIAQTGKKHTEETKEKIRKSMFLKILKNPISDETRSKLSLAAKAAWDRKKLQK